MAGIKINLATKSGLVTATGIILMFTGIIVQMITSAQSGEMNFGFHAGFNISTFSLPAIILVVVGFVMMAIGILRSLFGEDKKSD